MSRYIVEAEKLANKFGVLEKGEKFHGSEDDSLVIELLKNKDIKLFEDTKVEAPVETEVDTENPPVEVELVDEEETPKKKRK